MKRLILTSIVLIIVILTGNLASAQTDTSRGNYQETRRGLLDANNVEATFYNMGEIGDWMNQPTESFNWPKGSGHMYIAGTAFIVQARTVAKSGTPIHPLETNYYEYTRRDPFTGVTYGWWPLAGYARPGQMKPAISSDSSTWPRHWPDKAVDWDGQWNGYFGKGPKPGLTETYFVMDDNEDREYLPVFHPDSSDTTRGGLGLKVRVRAMEWDALKTQDILFVQFVISNEGTTRYDSTFVAQYVDYDIGGHDNLANNSAEIVPSSHLFIARSLVPYGTPGHWSPVGVLGIAVLGTPENKGLTSGRTFAVHEYDLNDDEHYWSALNSATFVLQNTSGMNAACFLSSGPFVLEPGEQKNFVLAYVFANDSVDLITKVHFAQQFFASGLDDSLLTSAGETRTLPIGFKLEQNYPNPFNPSTNIKFQIPNTSQVTLKIFDVLGREVRTLVSEEMHAGYYEKTFEGAALASGVYFYRLQAGDFVQTKKLLLLR